RFREEWHDRMGRCYWEMTQVKPVDDQGRLVGNPPGEWQRSLQLLAGRHWFLSSRDDAPSRQARALLLQEYAANPWDLFRHFYFADYPFDKFSPPIQQRLQELRRLLEAADYDEEQVAGLLWQTWQLLQP